MNKAFKAFVAGAAGLALVGGSAATASAQTDAAALQAQIDALLAQIAAISGGSTPVVNTGTTGATTTSGYVHTVTLRQGDRGSQVASLQDCLNRAGFSTGVADGAFGPMTAAGVRAAQAANGLAVDAVVGPNTGRLFGQLCAVTVAPPVVVPPVVVPPVDGGSDDDSEGSSSSSSNDLMGDEASIGNATFEDPSDTDIFEGDNRVPLGYFEFDVEDGSILLNRLTARFQMNTSNGTEADPWDIFETFYLEYDGNEIAEEPADDKDDWIVEDSPFQFRFSGLDEVIHEEDDVEIWLFADIFSSVDGISGSTTEDWQVDGAVTSSARFTDISDFTDSFTFTGNTVLTLKTEGGEDELDVQENDDDFDAMVIDVDDASTENDVDVFLFDLDVDSDSSDLTFDDIQVTVTVVDPNGGVDLAAGSTSSAFDTVIDDIYLEINGKKEKGSFVLMDTEFTAATTAETGVGRYTFDFDDNLTIDAGDVEEATVSMDFKAQGGSGSANYDNGTTVMVSVSSGSATTDSFQPSEVEGESGDSVSDISGSATGEAHALMESGIMVEFTDTNTVVTTADSEPDAVQFVFEFEVTAFDSDAYILSDATNILTADVASELDILYGYDPSSTGLTIAASGATITDNTDATEATGTGGDITGEALFKISESSTEKFTITITGDNGAGGSDGPTTQYRGFLTDIQFATALDGTVQSYTFDVQDESEGPYQTAK